MRIDIRGTWDGAKRAFDQVASYARQTGTRINRSFSSIQSAVGRGFRALGSALGPFGVALSAGAIVAGARSIINSIDEIGKQSRNLGVSAEYFQKLKYAAERTNTPIENITTAISRIRRAAGNAKLGNVESLKIFQQLKIDLDELDKLNPEELFDRVTSALSNMTDARERDAVAAKLFEESYARMTNFMNEYKKLGDELASRGGIISSEHVAAAEAFNDACTNIKQNLVAWSVNSGFIEQLQKIAEGLSAAASNAERLKNLGITENLSSSESFSKRFTRMWLNYLVGGVAGVAIGKLTGTGPWGLGTWLLGPEEYDLETTPEENEKLDEYSERRAAAIKRLGELTAEERRLLDQAKSTDEIGEIENKIIQQREASAQAAADLKNTRAEVLSREEFTDDERAQIERATSAAEVLEIERKILDVREKAAQAAAEEQSRRAEAAENSLSEMLESLEKRLNRSRMIARGERREAAITDELERARDIAERGGIELTPEQISAIRNLAGQNFDESQRGKNAERSKTASESRTVYADSLRRIGGNMEGAAQTVNYQRRTAEGIVKLVQQVGTISQKMNVSATDFSLDDWEF